MTGSAYFRRSRSGLHFLWQEAQLPASVKAYKTYDEQVDLLASRGMDVGDRDAAIKQLQHINYYRLSGYWYSFRRQGPQTVKTAFTPQLLSTMSLGFTALMRVSEQQPSPL
jgi:hypothetical protein